MMEGKRVRVITRALCMMMALLFTILQTGCIDVSVNHNPGPFPQKIDEIDSGSSGESDVAVEDIPEEVAEADTKDPDDIPKLRDAVASSEGLGEDAIVGACLGSNGLIDDKFMDLVHKHFNAVTLENELKPESVLGKKSPAKTSLHEEDLDGKKVSVPTLDHTRADMILDDIVAWNETAEDGGIKVRGHVLVWHQQTPEWFFHEDYDLSRDLVSKEEMNERLEWYIRSMLEYYTGEDSKYRGLFYGWDVVNEAVSDRSGSYRKDTEDSYWWKVYGSNEYIINAFKYANKYAPEELELYYNDYNECNKSKMRGIIQLIDDVKESEGTRIDGFGMQGHYSVNAPTADQIDEAARQYAQHVNKIMITELDVGPSMLYDGTEEKLPKEFERQGKYYKAIYETLKQLQKDGINVRGVTFWGVIDPYSWRKGLHPLLFDDDYNAKPAYWAFVE